MSRRHQTRTRRRFLSMETLEERRLLVVGIVPADVPLQNFANPEDANYDGVVSPGDALIVINELNNPNQSGSPASSSKDIDGDGVVTPRDALLIINRLNNRSPISSIAPQQRAIGLKTALDAGYVPPNMSLSQAHELLETLENGGHYEVGERFRNGQMININDHPDDLDDSIVEAEGETGPWTQQSADSASENLLPETNLLLAEEENDPFALLQSADDALTAHLFDSTLWRNFSESGEGDGLALVDRFATRVSEVLADADARDRVVQAIADALQDGDRTVEDIIDELQALRATLGDAHSQIAQIFANLDVEGILDQLGVDLGTLAEALLSHDHSDPSNHEAIFGGFLSRNYLRNLDAILP
ncbi:MAG TPA: dockerin type I domain-containing protein [Pirellulaceae bacterium]|nr:dockerin type I domain-containing protein [Pirellulaceae bacterium]